MYPLTLIEVSNVQAGQGLSQYHKDEIQASNWPSHYRPSPGSDGGERLNWYLATQRRLDQFEHSPVR